MTEQRSRFLSTGEAAARLSVQPDTVLKWIRRGRLKAWRTEGGHNRIDPADLENLLGGSDGEPRPEPSRPLRCFEYFSENGVLREACSQCIVYHSRASRCFEAQRWLCEKGAGRTCPGSCDSCSFFRRVHRLAERVLVVSADTELRERLESRVCDNLILRFASGAYKASIVVGAFLPGVVVVDQDLPAEEWKELIRALEDDERIPWVRIVVAVNHSAAVDQFPHKQPVSEWLVKPFNLEDLVRAVGSLEVEFAESAPSPATEG
jgi:excisionase family DNA binding protein